MARLATLHRLNPAFVRTCSAPGVYMDGGGLRFRVMANGSRTWIMRIAIGKVRRDVCLGPSKMLSLAEARAKADDIRKAVFEGRNPIEERRVERLPATPSDDPVTIDDGPTFEECWKTFWLFKEQQLSNGKHGDQWVSTMATYVLPHIGKRPVADIKPGEIIDMLKSIWTAKEETARRVLQRVDAIFVSAITRELRDKASPCTGVARELGQRRQDRNHHAALPYGEVAGFLDMLRERNGNLASRLAFEFLILTATRSGETRGARWTEMDSSARLWTIGADRMKARTEHIVPLSERCVAILETVRAAYPTATICFPNSKGNPFSDMVFTKTLRDMGLGKRATAHGFRTSFKIWAAETGIRDEVSEAALAHSDQNRVRAAYRRTTYLEERRSVMDKWARVVCPKQ